MKDESPGDKLRQLLNKKNKRIVFLNKQRINLVNKIIELERVIVELSKE